MLCGNCCACCAVVRFKDKAVPLETKVGQSHTKILGNCSKLEF